MASPLLMETHRIPPRNLAVREEDGLMGMLHQQQQQPQNAQLQSSSYLGSSTQLDNDVTPMAERSFVGRRDFGGLAPQFSPANIGGTLDKPTDSDYQRLIGEQYQRRDTNKSWAPAPVYPSQRRLQETAREVVPKNHQEFELVGRNIGPHNTADAVGGYAGRDNIGHDVTEKLTQRTTDDFKNYFHPTAAARFNRGAPAVRNQFHQDRVTERELDFKDAPGRFSGAFNHDIRRVGHAQDELWQKRQFGVLKETTKRDDGMIYRQREDEAPDRGGLRMQYADVYQEWGIEELETPRRVQHTAEFDIDPTMITPWHVNPYTPPVGSIPYSGQHSEDLNDPAHQASLRGRVPGQMY